MIKTHYRNRADKTKISRHCSQLAIKKLTQNCSSKQQQVSLQNIRKTTFWVKRAIGPAGIQNLPPNSRKIDQFRNNAFSMKVQTQVSQTNSTCPKNNMDIDFMEEIYPKLTAVEKSQKQIIDEVNLIVEQQLPRLSICQQLYSSLTKILKLAFKNSPSIPCSQFQKIIDNHIKATSSLFVKVVKHSADFINANKCANLISKNIELQKQNSKLIDALSKIQLDAENVKSNQFKNVLNTQINSLKQIDYQRILLTNYKLLHKPVQRQQLNELCCSILSPCLRINNIQNQSSQFELNSKVLNGLINLNGGITILKRFVNRHKNMQSAKSEQCLSILFIYKVLDFKFQPLIFDLVKKYASKQSVLIFQNTNQKSKINLKFVLKFLKKFSFLSDKQKLNQIIMSLLSKATIFGQKNFNERQMQQISNLIGESKKQTYSKGQELVQNIEKPTKNNKRLVNCANIYQNRKSKNVSCEKKSCSISNNLQNLQQNLYIQTNILNSVEISVNQIILLGYFFILDQFQFFKQASMSLSKAFGENDNSLSVLKNLRRLISKRMYDNIEQMDKNQKQSIANLVEIVITSYKNENAFAYQYKKIAMLHMFQVLKKEIIMCLDFLDKKLVLAEIINDKK